MDPVSQPLVHGTAHGYSNYGCHCDACMAAWRQYHSQRRQRMYAARVLVGGYLVAPVPAERHGRISTYNNAGCRCQPCRDAHAASVAKNRQRKAAS